jgi:hypothetical protein
MIVPLTTMINAKVMSPPFEVPALKTRRDLTARLKAPCLADELTTGVREGRGSVRPQGFFSPPLVARRDLPRAHAELIDVPIADDHLDRGHRFVTATHSLGAAYPHRSQVLQL